MRESLSPHPPNQVNVFYEKIIDQITRLSEKNRIRAFRALSWVLLAVRPLTMNELREAVLIESGNTEINTAVMKEITDDIIIRWCRSLLVYEPSSNIVRFNHMTVKEFLESSASKFNEYRLFPKDLARSCLTYLGSKEFETLCEGDESLLIRMTKYKFAKYAGDFWGVHTKDEIQNDDKIQRLILKDFGVRARRQAIYQFTKQSVLHITARYGLAKICALLLDQERRYIVSRVSLIIKRIEGSRPGARCNGKR